MSLSTMANNILRFSPGLNLDIIKSVLQDSYRQLCLKDWNRLKLTRQIYTVAPYSTGTVAVAADGIVTGVSTVFTVGMVGRQMKVYYSDSFFEIQSFSSATSITLKDWPGTVVAAGTTFSIFKVIYPVDPTFKLVWDVVYQIPLKKKSQSYFNKIDPGRASTGSSPTSWALAEMSLTGAVQIEIYPIPTDVITLRVYGKMGGLALADGDTAKLPEDLIESLTLIDCYRLKNLKEPGQGWDEAESKQVQRYAVALADFEEEDFQLGEHNERVKDMMEELAFPSDDNFNLSHDTE